ncbi:spore germination protein KB [Marinithermofilum abyssi]|uniref:Spore germination protein KB n=1 Tax=Marinithermofilum abyssi TaxID=1571185 RepID=A0A8J2VKK6_9BACL|nr:GerAB/ArcD/ProY family transporter [Marinithermofilum abyssi]GGE29172.1 spore germination protein KB [Marinithermofilum abyssi]
MRQHVTEKVQSYQLFSLVVFFELGTTIVLGNGIHQARQDAWLANLLGVGVGLLLFLVYARLYLRYPALSLTGSLQKICGKPVGWILGLVYVEYFLYLAARDLKDFTRLLQVGYFPLMPIAVTASFMLLIVIYVLTKGLEGLAGTSFVFFIFFSVMFCTTDVLILLFGEVKPEQLQPVLENGWRPVFQTVFPLMLTFPYGEMIAFTMMLPFCRNQPRKNVKTALWGILVSGLVLTVTVILDIVVSGVDISARSSFPYLITISQVEVGTFLQRLDVVTILVLIMGGFFKIGVFLHAAVVGAADLFGVHNPRKFLLPFATVVLVTFLTMAESLMEHIQIGLQIVPKYVHLPLQLGIPLLLLIVDGVKSRTKKQRSAGENFS